jgi:hypothetical protein
MSVLPWQLQPAVFSEHRPEPRRMRLPPRAFVQFWSCFFLTTPVDCSPPFNKPKQKKMQATCIVSLTRQKHDTSSEACGHTHTHTHTHTHHADDFRGPSHSSVVKRSASSYSVLCIWVGALHTQWRRWGFEHNFQFLSLSFNRANHKNHPAITGWVHA